MSGVMLVSMAEWQHMQWLQHDTDTDTDTDTGKSGKCDTLESFLDWRAC